MACAFTRCQRTCGASSATAPKAADDAENSPKPAAWTFGSERGEAGVGGAASADGGGGGGGAAWAEGLGVAAGSRGPVGKGGREVGEVARGRARHPGTKA